jgi:hypothetical protein
MAVRMDNLEAIRRGRRGLALVLYLDMAIEEVEDSWQDFPEVLALSAEAGSDILDSLKMAIDSAQAMELRDRAAQSLSLLLSISPELQAMIAPMLEGVAGQREEDANLVAGAPL